MKFGDKYPDAQYLEECEPGIVHGSIETPCENCNALTYWYELNFEAYLCSEECVEVCKQ